jgi:hypothetical protein
VRALGCRSRALSSVQDEEDDEANDGEDADRHANANASFRTIAETSMANSIS